MGWKPPLGRSLGIKDLGAEGARSLSLKELRVKYFVLMEIGRTRPYAAARARICLISFTWASAPKGSAYRSKRATLKAESLPRISTVCFGPLWPLHLGATLDLDLSIRLPKAIIKLAQIDSWPVQVQAGGWD